MISTISTRIKKISGVTSKRLKAMKEDFSLLSIKHSAFTDSDLMKIPVFVLACQRSGTTMILNIFEKCPECLVYQEDNNLAYNNYRVRSNNRLQGLIKRSSKRVIVFKPLNDIQYADRFLSLHSNAKAIWIYRNYHDVVKSGVVKWGAHHKDIMYGISKGYTNPPKYAASKTIKERMDPETLELVKSLCNEDMSYEDASALLWYVRNSIFFKLELQKDDRVLLVKYEDLVARPLEQFIRLFDYASCVYDEEYTKNIHTSSVRKLPLPAIEPRIEKLCREMMKRLDEQYKPN